MKALSIRQPWAWLIVKGLKDVDNRRRKTNFRGRVYVHAGNHFDVEALIDSRLCPWLTNALINEEAGEMIDQLHKEWKDGAIIGEVDIVDCKYRFGSENDSLYSPWHDRGWYGFILANPVLYDKPIPCKGKLGFFEPNIKQ